MWFAHGHPAFSPAHGGSRSDSRQHLQHAAQQRRGASSRRLSLAVLAVSKGRPNSKGRPASETHKRAAAAGRQRRKLDASQPPSPLQLPERVPLHACLLAAGITDLAPFSAASHLALSEEAVRREVQPKLAALQAEGVGPEGMAKLLYAERQAMLWCDCTAVFQPNWRVLQQIAAHMQRERHPATPQRTALGAALARGPAFAAQYLARDPQLTQQLLAWLEGSLGIGLQQLAGSQQLFHALMASMPAASAVAAVLQQRGVPTSEAGSVFLRFPTSFQLDPTTLGAKLQVLQRELDVPAAKATRLVLQEPRFMGHDLGARLPPLLAFLDDYMGQPGAGRRLLLAQPGAGNTTADSAQRTIAALEVRGYGAAAIRIMVGKSPTLLKAELDSPLQQQKLKWIETVSPWTLDDFLLRNSRYFATTTRRLASRLALLQQLGVAPPESPGTLAVYSDARFGAWVGSNLQPPRALGAGYVKEWEDAWLKTEEGREWGFPPFRR